MPREAERRLITHQGLREVSAAVVNCGQRANGREVFGCASQHALELGFRRVEVVDFDEGTSEGYARGEITWMSCEPRAARGDRLVKFPSPTILLRELRERLRRRILLDPASKLFNTRIL